MTIFEISLFGVHIAPTYYGLFYAIAFAVSYWYIARKKVLSEDHLDLLTLYMLVGVVVWWRLGHVLFYTPEFYFSHPLEILKTWNGGMSFHGGTIGVLVMLWIFAKKYKHSFFTLWDTLCLILPFGLGLGRIANYLNKELLGFHYNGFLAVQKGGESYFPSPLLESFLEGFCLFFIVQFVATRQKYAGQVGGAFLLFYGLFRFLAEYTKLIEPQNIFVIEWLTKGQALSVPMILFGIYFLFFFTKYPLKPKK